MVKPYTSLNIHDILDIGGLISRDFDCFESRPQQIEMAEAVRNAVNNKKHLTVEAGTGVGKSFAYLVPAIMATSKGKGRFLISTYTITLQEQLINKDIPFLAEHLPFNFTAVLAKGRSNYVCLRRLEFALRKSAIFFSQLTDELTQINNWASSSTDGSLSDIPSPPSRQAWEAVKSEHENCPARRCGHFQKCFYRRARRQLETADIIVANHALMFSDLALKEKSVDLLPDYSYVIIDEAHNTENVAQSHFGIDITDRQIKFLLDRLYNTRTHRGLLAHNKKADKALDTISRIKSHSRQFFNNVKNWYESNKAQNNGRCSKNFIEDTLSPHLKKLRTQLSAIANGTEDIDEKFEILRFANRCAALIKDMDDFISQKRDDYVYWIEASRSSHAYVRLKSAALNIGPDIKRVLFDKYESVILTSATLTCDQKDLKQSFAFFTGRIGLEDFKAVRLGSPFNYEKLVKIYIEKDLPNPNQQNFVTKAADALKKYIVKTNGNAFVLFTSYKMMHDITDQLNEWFLQNNIQLFQQDAGTDRTTLLRNFKETKRAVLFGTDSFWQGVDVPGRNLSNVIIVRLPFAVPDQPLLAGRLEQIAKTGGNPFLDYQLPSAIIKFKQGFGRLVRTKDDTGIVVILDSRIVNKPYGSRFLSAVPKCKVEIVTAEKTL